MSGRGECGRGQGQKNAEVSDHVWAVVATLVRALTDARDHLVTLIHSSNPTRVRGGGSAGGSCLWRSLPTRSASPYPGAGPWVPNGNHRLRMFASSPGRVRPAQRPLFHAEVSPPPEGRRPSRRCGTHPLHRMHALRDSPGPGSISPYPPPRTMQQYSPCKQRPASSCNRNVTIQQGRYQQRLSPDQRRHCIGAEYAALLREESSRMRERRRMAQQSCRGPRLPR